MVTETRPVVTWRQGRRKFSGMLEMFFILTGVVFTQGHAFVETHQTVHLTWVLFISWNLYFNLLKGCWEKKKTHNDRLEWLKGLRERARRTEVAVSLLEVTGYPRPLFISPQAVSSLGTSPSPEPITQDDTRRYLLWSEGGWLYSFHIPCIRNIFHFLSACFFEL